MMKRVLRYTVLLLCLAFSSYPLVWMFLSAFRKDLDVLERPFGLPDGFRLQNLETVLSQGGFHDAGANGCLLLAVFALSVLLFFWMWNMVRFIVRWWHLGLWCLLAALWQLSHRMPGLGRALGSAGFVTAYVNSVLLCVLGVTAAIMLAELAAFAFARLSFRGSRVLFLLFLLGMMVPIHVTLIPLNLFLGPQYLNLKGSLFALAGPYVAFALPVSVLILRSAFADVPGELIDAARIDGCNAWQVFRHLALPLSRQAISTVLIFNFLTMWNDYAFALTLGSSRKPTLPLALNDFKGEHGSLDIAVICAALVVTVLPLLLVYAFAQKQIIKGLTAGAVKE